jgi:hypothetical protein
MAQLASVIRSWWTPTYRKDNIYVTQKESFFDAFVKTAHWNSLRERCPLDTALLYLSEAREIMGHILSSLWSEVEEAPKSDIGQASYRYRYREALGRSFIELDNGYIGMTSAVAEEDDRVCVILGCPLPMILRPNSSGRYQVVGPAYVHGLMDAEAVLGPLPSDFIVQVGTSAGWYGGFKFFNTITNETVTEDPRLGDLPPVWVQTEAARLPTDPLHFMRYRNLADGKTINGDPRLLPEALRARGTSLKPLKLV